MAGPTARCYGHSPLNVHENGPDKRLALKLAHLLDSSCLLAASICIMFAVFACRAPLTCAPRDIVWKGGRSRLHGLHRAFRGGLQGQATKDGCSLALCTFLAGPVPYSPTPYPHEHACLLLQIVIVLILRPEILHLLVD